MLLTLALIQAIAAPLPISPYPILSPKNAALAGPPRDFEEIPQEVQYDGDYSPPIGRPAEPEPEPGKPVRLLQPWEKDIPVIVPPTPKIVYQKAPEPDRSDSNPGFDPGPATYRYSPDETAPPPPTNTRGAGSPTGSSAVADYSTAPRYSGSRNRSQNKDGIGQEVTDLAAPAPQP